MILGVVVDLAAGEPRAVRYPPVVDEVVKQTVLAAGVADDTEVVHVGIRAVQRKPGSIENEIDMTAERGAVPAR